MSVAVACVAAARKALSCVDGVVVHGGRLVPGMSGATAAIELDLDLWHPSLHLDRRAHRIDVRVAHLQNALVDGGMEIAQAREQAESETLAQLRGQADSGTFGIDSADVGEMSDRELVDIARRYAERLAAWQAPRARNAIRVGLETPIPIHVIHDESNADTADRIRIGHLAIDPVTLELMIAGRPAHQTVAAIRRVVCECIDPHRRNGANLSGPVDDGDTVCAPNPRTDKPDWWITAKTSCEITFPIALDGGLLEDEGENQYEAGVVTLYDHGVPLSALTALVGRPLRDLVRTVPSLDSAVVLSFEEVADGIAEVTVEKRPPMLLRDHPVMAAVLGE